MVLRLPSCSLVSFVVSPGCSPCTPCLRGESAVPRRIERMEDRRPLRLTEQVKAAG